MPIKADFTPAPTLTFGDLRILNKQHQIVPLTLNAAQRQLLAYLSGRDLVLKARQLGISTAIQAHLFLKAITTTARIGTLAHDAATTDKLREMAQFFYAELPEDDRPPRSINNHTKTTYPATRSTVYIATAGNRSAGRGGTYSHVHGSEVAFWKDGAALLAGLMQGVPTAGQILLESTPNGQQGWFYEQCMKALDGDPTWRLHFFPWWIDPHYRIDVGTRHASSDGAGYEVRGANEQEWAFSHPAPRTTHPIELSDDEMRLVAEHHLDMSQIAWRRMKIRELGELFAQEYPEDPYSAFIASGMGYFRLSDALFTAAREATPQDGHRYIAGLDFGQANDYTVCAVIDVTTRQQVALLRINRQPWAAIRAQVVDLCRRWKVATLVAESNSMGQPIIEALWGELSAASCRTQIHPFTMTHTDKTSLMAGLHMALVESGLQLLDDPVQKHELRVFTSKQTPTGTWQLGAPRGEHDDCVIALALAWHGAGGGLFVFGTG